MDFSTMIPTWIKAVTSPESSCRRRTEQSPGYVDRLWSDGDCRPGGCRNRFHRPADGRQAMTASGAHVPGFDPGHDGGGAGAD